MANTASAYAHAMASFGAPTGFGGLFDGIGARYRAHRNALVEQSRVRRELESYTDRQLSDLGLSRHDIAAISTGQFTR